MNEGRKEKGRSNSTGQNNRPSFIRLNCFSKRAQATPAAAATTNPQHITGMYASNLKIVRIAFCYIFLIFTTFASVTQHGYDTASLYNHPSGEVSYGKSCPCFSIPLFPLAVCSFALACKELSKA